ncbi:ABC transporter permease subunit [Bacillus marasmi]|uniref:ABC transporter permease subunit n=1 Tax=Bacillus marasmi TaxID=1926279 RepID=UPI0011CA0977|nr:ABC transporter permease subunit [Bacillus marasmi]
MNIFWHELRANRKSTIIWSVSLILLAILYLSFYPAFAKDAEQFTKIMEGYPEAVRIALGVNNADFYSILGFYCFPLAFITLCGAIQAMNLGTSIVSREVREKTADFLLTKPVTRSAVITAKLLAALASIVITNIAYLLAAILTAEQVKTADFSIKIFLLLSLTLLFIQLIFLSIGFIVSVMFQKIRSVLTVSLATVFAFYFLGMLSDTSGESAKRFISPFKYFDTAYIMKHAGFEGEFLLAGGIIFLLAVALSYFIYRKKDIHTL